MTRKKNVSNRNQQFSDRFKRTLSRLLNEVSWLRIEQTALERLEGKEVLELNFFRVAYVSLHGDRIIRLIRVLEDSKEVASFWYLHRCNRERIDELLEGTDLHLDKLKDFSERVKHIRNKTFAHIDKDRVFDPEAVYEEAGIKGEEIRGAVEAVWFVLNKLYEDITHCVYRHRYGEYSGDDIDHLFQLFEKE